MKYLITIMILLSMMIAANAQDFYVLIDSIHKVEHLGSKEYVQVEYEPMVLYFSKNTQRVTIRGGYRDFYIDCALNSTEVGSFYDSKDASLFFYKTYILLYNKIEKKSFSFFYDLNNQ